MNRNFHILYEAEQVIDDYIKRRCRTPLKNRKKSGRFFRVFICILGALCAVSAAVCAVNLILWYTA